MLTKNFLKKLAIVFLIVFFLIIFFLVWKNKEQINGWLVNIFQKESHSPYFVIDIYLVFKEPSQINFGLLPWPLEQNDKPVNLYVIPRLKDYHNYRAQERFNNFIVEKLIYETKEKKDCQRVRENIKPEDLEKELEDLAQSYLFFKSCILTDVFLFKNKIASGVLDCNSLDIPFSWVETFNYSLLKNKELTAEEVLNKEKTFKLIKEKLIAEAQTTQFWPRGEKRVPCQDQALNIDKFYLPSEEEIIVFIRGDQSDISYCWPNRDFVFFLEEISN